MTYEVVKGMDILNGRPLKRGDHFDSSELPHRRIITLELQGKIRPAAGEGRPTLHGSPVRLGKAGLARS